MAKKRWPTHRDELVVMESLRAVRPTTNPYLIQLIDSLERVPDVTVLLFSFRTAILGRYDVLHVHWPEVLFTSGTRGGRLYRWTLTTLLLARLVVTRIPVVRTWHNLERPQGLSRYENWLLDGFDRLTTLRIGLNETTVFPDGRPYAIVPHGHYRDWYRPSPHVEPVPGRISYAGSIRRYKGVESLVAAFVGIDDPGLSLRVAGKPSSDELQQGIVELCANDPRVTCHFGFLDDEEFVREISEAELVVLPYPHMHNSGIVLACLSLDRPVLVPDNEVNRLLAAEVGPKWLHWFQGEITADALRAAIAELRSDPPSSPPDLSRREWDKAGADHVAAFRRALAVRRHGATAEADTGR